MATQGSPTVESVFKNPQNTVSVSPEPSTLPAAASSPPEYPPEGNAGATSGPSLVPEIRHPNEGENGSAEGVTEEVVTKPTSLESVVPEAAPPALPEAGKPQVIVRIRPSNVPLDASTIPIFEVDQQTKTIQIRVDRERKSPAEVAGGSQHQHKLPPHGFLYFPADAVLESSSQEELYAAVAQDLVDKALQGVPGMVVGIGPEQSGKSFSLFGLSGRYSNRGIAPRVLEKMFEIKERRKEETDLKFGMGIVEVRRDRIRDLLTLSPREINDVGERGPKDMYVEEVDCMEHGVGLMLRALIGQKLIHPDAYERYHTLLYFEIVGVSPLAAELIQFTSRITFAEIASAPLRQDCSQPLNKAGSRTSDTFFAPTYCPMTPPPQKTEKFKTKQQVFPNRKCVHPGYSQGPLAESIAVRRDIFALEQIFLKANEQYRIRKYFSKLETLGLSMIASEKKRLTSGHNFRQNRLAHCLKDILDKGTEMRILLHVRPDKQFLRASLEAMRFAERAKLVPRSVGGEEGKAQKRTRTEEQILQEVIGDIAPELMHPTTEEELTMNSEKMKVIQEQAVKYFEENIESSKVLSKEKVKGLFDNFRVLWNFLWELELNVTLRKAEEEMKSEMEKLSAKVGLLVPQDSEPRRRSQTRGRGSDLVGRADLDGEEEGVGKKSTRRMKKREKKSKKRVGEEKRDKRRSSEELKKGDEDKASDKAGAEEEKAGSRKGSDAAHVDLDAVKGEAEVNNTSPPETVVGPELSAVVGESAATAVTAAGPLEVPVPTEGRTTRTSFSRRVTMELTKEELVAAVPGVSIQAADRGASPPDEQKANTRSSKESVPGGGGLPAEGEKPVTARPESGSARIHPHSPPMRPSHYGGFADFKLRPWTAHTSASQQRPSLTEEERQQLAAQHEEQIAANFEEMKKVARRQAIHLLRAGVKKPQWTSLF